MFDAARGKRPMPTADELRAWAIKLGTPGPGEPHGAAPSDGWVEAGLVCQACAGDAPGGKCCNPKCVGGPVVRELVPAHGATAAPGGQPK
jgi:hypothetical protein